MSPPLLSHALITGTIVDTLEAVLSSTVSVVKAQDDPLVRIAVVAAIGEVLGKTAKELFPDKDMLEGILDGLNLTVRQDAGLLTQAEVNESVAAYLTETILSPKVA